MRYSVLARILSVVCLSLSAVVYAESDPSSSFLVEGSVVLKPVSNNSYNLFLRVKLVDESFRDYLFLSCDETCQRGVGACRSSGVCTVQGTIDETVPGIRPDWVRPGSVSAQNARTLASKKADSSVVNWTRDIQNPRLGEAWKDPSGVVWGDIARDENGAGLTLNHEDARKYCENNGSTLPSREDFIRLREYMGARPGSHEGFIPQVLPNLTYNKNGTTYGYWFWSSSLQNSNDAYDFNGGNGVIIAAARSYPKIHVLCISK